MVKLKKNQSQQKIQKSELEYAERNAAIYFFFPNHKELAGINFTVD